MDRRLSLGLAIGTAAAAVLLVAVDLQFNTVASLETQQDGEWVVVAEQDADGFGYSRPQKFVGCASPELRIVIDNGVPWGRSVDILVTAFSYAGGEQTIVSETVDVAGGGQEVVPFTVPADIFNQTGDPERDLGNVQVQVEVDNIYLWTCVEADA